MFDIDTTKLKCKYCNKKVTLEKCGIMPTLSKGDKGMIITCDSPICLYEYLAELDEYKKRVKELEELAYNNLTGEQIENELDDIDPKLKQEYQDLIDS